MADLAVYEADQSAPESPRYVHLRVCSDFSLCKGIAKVDRLVEEAAAMKMPALALTDSGNLFGLVKFYSACLQKGVKPLVGADFAVIDEDSSETPANLLLLVRNSEGYENLLELIMRTSHEPHETHRSVLRIPWLKSHSAGLIALSGHARGSVGQALLADDQRLARHQAEKYGSLFPGAFYLEAQRLGRREDERCLRGALDLAAELQLPVVATNDVCFLREDEFVAHETRVCISVGDTLNLSRERLRYSKAQHLKSADAMCEIFHDYPELVRNTVEIARRCNHVLELGVSRMPQFPVEHGKTEAGMLAELTQKGLQERLSQAKSSGGGAAESGNEEGERVGGAEQGEGGAEQRTGEEIKSSAYQERLDSELQIINEMGFAGYFLIVTEFITWARKNDVPVGPGRGSAAGSLVAYCLGITNLDPLRYGLLFERFLNPERRSPPDIDVDFCIEGREKVIRHVEEVYGKESVSQIATFGVMAARAVVRDATRALGKPYGLGDRLAKLIPGTPNILLRDAIAGESALQERLDSDPEAKEVMDMAKQLEGVVRNLGKHAGGVVIASDRLANFVPLIEDESGSLLTQFDKDDIEKIGLVKFDFLGLKTLTIIEKSIIIARASGEDCPPIDDIPLDDKAVFKMLGTGDTTAIFQLESSGMQGLIRKLRPDRFEDLISLVALYRPGPLQSGMVDDYIERKHGRAKIRYDHPVLMPLLKETYGIILYQEQVMQIAQRLAGYKLGEADILRRAMGKKKQEEMDAQESRFLAGAEANDVGRATAKKIFDQVSHFAGYGFNKSHSAAYALLAYQTAWLKCHHPAAFMSAVLTADIQDTDKLKTMVDECRSMGLKVLPPCLNHSDCDFIVEEPECIRYGLGALKGLGHGLAHEIVRGRESGLYEDIFDCARRLEGKLNKAALSVLIRAGACDSLPGTPRAAAGEAHRAALLESVEDAFKYALQAQQSLQQEDLFGDLHAPVLTSLQGRASSSKEQTNQERLANEKAALGFYLSGHPMSDYQQEMEGMRACRVGDLAGMSEGEVKLLGIVIGVRKRRTKNGGKIILAELDDGSGTVEIMLSEKLWKEGESLLAAGKILAVEVRVSMHDGRQRVRAANFFDIAEVRRRWLGQLWITLSQEVCSDAHMADLRESLCSHHSPNGGCAVAIRYLTAEGEGTASLGEAYQVEPGDELLTSISDSVGPGRTSWQCLASG